MTVLPSFVGFLLKKYRKENH